MTKWMLAALLSAATPALASSDGFFPMFDVPSSSVDRAARDAVARMEPACHYSEFSRLPPRPEAMRSCNAAEERVVSMGSSGARAAMARLDDPNLPSVMRNRLYDVIARSGDLAFVEPLLTGLERESRAGVSNFRTWERYSIVRTLQTLTYAAEMPGTPAIQWRAYWDAHKKMTRPQLLAQRIADARESLEAPVPAAATAARFLLSQKETKDEGVQALGRLFARANLSQSDRVALTQVALQYGITPPPVELPRQQPTQKVVGMRAS